ncbi:acyl-CoA dehydrogenase family protein [Raineyella sp.]|uniref:acyl-CoA dehydrogenase family protein n=1 Tax=Raineyella sp. TaxID=1911550 RepID=UPI002B207A6B|nr:acyl-CoA dehydrogenase family protein [Raineyella sp.]MEA5155291.1 acyl-CoA dehydrogenase family protein [Raineyella sp.]
MRNNRNLAAPAGPARERAFQEALEVLRERRDEFNEQGYVPRDYIDLLKKAGIYRASTPTMFGGEPLPPAEFLDRIEQIAAVDPATGWVASFGSALVYFGALPLESQAEIYADGPDVVFSAGQFPMQEVEEVDGGYRCTGVWQFASGSAGADLLGIGLKGGPEAQGRPRTAVFDAEDVRIVPNWDVSGMRATGSNELHLTDAFVPAGRTFIRGSASNIDEPLNRYPVVAYAAQVLAVVALGAARGALDHLHAVGRSTSVTGGRRRGAQGTFQIGLARAEAQLRSARAWFYQASREVYALAEAGTEISDETTALLRLAATNAAHVGRAVVLAVFDLAGTGAIYTTHPLQRYLQDGLVPPQHAMLASATYEAAGAVLLGEQPAVPSFP